MPAYIAPQQKNLDLRTQEALPYVKHKFTKIKPGKGYFTQIFFTLLILLFFTLFFYKSITGESKTAALADVSL